MPSRAPAHSSAPKAKPKTPAKNPRAASPSRSQSPGQKKDKKRPAVKPLEGAGIGELPPDNDAIDVELDDHVRDHLRSVLADPPAREMNVPRRREAHLSAMHETDEYTYVRHYQSHVDTFFQWILMIARGVSGKLKVMEYDLRALVRYGGVITSHLPGTLITMDFSCTVFVVVMAACFAMVFSLVHGMVDEGKEVETFVLEKITTNMNQVVPFVLGLYVTLALHRWWTIRTDGLACIFSAIVDLQMVVACVMRSERHRAVRTLIMKWSFASIFLLLKAVRGQSSMKDMLFKGLLTQAEIDILNEVKELHGRPHVLWGWVMRLVHESFSEAVGPMPYSIHTAKAAEIIMNASSGLSIIDIHLRTALPFVYVHIITLMVDVNNFFFITKTATVAAVAYSEEEWMRLGSELLVCLLVPTLYRGLLSITYAIFDPFGEDLLDFPVAAIMDWNASCCFAVFQAQEMFPGVPDSFYSGSRLSSKSNLKPSEADPARFEETKVKFRRVIVNTYRSGKLELVVRQAVEKAKNEEQVMPAITNAKSKAAVLAATAFAEPVAREIRKFGKAIRDDLIRVRHDAYQLHKAIDHDALLHRKELEKALIIVGETVQSQVQELLADAPEGSG